MATFSAAATFTSSANNLLESTLNLTASRNQVVNMDAAYQTIYIGTNATQSAYQSADSAGSVAAMAYVYVRNQPSNHSTCEVDIIYQSQSANVYIGKLKPGDWFYLPYQRQVNHPDSSSIKLVNKSADSGSYITVLFAESGSM